MRYGAIRFSDVSNSDRLDAGFHLTRASLEQDGSADRAKQVATELLMSEMSSRENPGNLVATFLPTGMRAAIMDCLDDSPEERMRLGKLILDAVKNEATQTVHAKSVASYLGLTMLVGGDGRGSNTFRENRDTSGPVKPGPVSAGIGALYDLSYEIRCSVITSLFTEEASGRFWAQAEELVGLDKLIEAKAYELVRSLDYSVRKRAVADLVRGDQNSPANVEKAIREYPFFALALAFRDEEADLIMKRKAEELMRRAEKISGIGARIRSKPM